MPLQKKSKSLALKTINERAKAHNASDEDGVEKEVAYLAKNFRKFLKESLVLNVMDMAISKRNVLII